MHFKQRSWVGIVEKATAHELIEIALNQTEYDTTEYTVFIGILKEMAGTDKVVSSIEGKVNAINMICYNFICCQLTCCSKESGSSSFP